MKTKVTFVYCESSHLWEVFVEGVADNIEALQAFNAVVITCGYVTPRIDHNKAAYQSDGSYKISIGL